MRGKDYRLYKPQKTGRYIVMQTGEKLDVEEFLPLVLYAVIPEKFDEQSQKTMIVILRTYIAERMEEQEHTVEMRIEDLGLPFTTYEDLMKRWGDAYEIKYNRARQYICETNKEKIYYNQKLIYPAYHELSAGMTNSGDADYLKPVESLSDKDSKQYMKLMYFSIENMKSKLQEYNHELNVEDLMNNTEVNKKENSEYVDSVTIGETNLSATDFVKIFDIPSESFTMEPFSDGFKIISSGKGSGKGLSIYGARKMAADGKTYKEILSYYYSGIEIK